ncbi:hypothetical protein BJX64DRAFT_135398 [Aspergillus heterothallicus]
MLILLMSSKCNTTSRDSAIPVCPTLCTGRLTSDLSSSRRVSASPTVLPCHALHSRRVLRTLPPASITTLLMHARPKISMSHPISERSPYPNCAAPDICGWMQRRALPPSSGDCRSHIDLGIKCLTCEALLLILFLVRTVLFGEGFQLRCGFYFLVSSLGCVARLHGRLVLRMRGFFFSCTAQRKMGTGQERWDSAIRRCWDSVERWFCG